ncbi:hypothetical protein [Streptomyces sp. E-08]
MAGGHHLADDLMARARAEDSDAEESGRRVPGTVRRPTFTSAGGARRE